MAKNQTKSTYRCPSGRASLPSPASCLCRAASTRTTALQSSRGNKHRFRCEMGYRPATSPARAPIRRDSTARPPESCNSSCLISPAAHKSSTAQTYLPDPTIPPRSNSAPSARAASPPPRVASRIRHNLNATQTHSTSESFRENISRWHSKARPAANKSRTHRNCRTQN